MRNLALGCIARTFLIASSGVFAQTSSVPPKDVPDALNQYGTVYLITSIIPAYLVELQTTLISSPPQSLPIA